MEQLCAPPHRVGAFGDPRLLNCAMYALFALLEWPARASLVGPATEASQPTAKVASDAPFPL